MTTRADLVVQESIYQGERCWIIKDPLAMKYFRLMGPEYQVFTALRQHTATGRFNAPQRLAEIEFRWASQTAAKAKKQRAKTKVVSVAFQYRFTAVSGL